MPLLNRLPETPYIRGLLMLLALILLATAARYHAFFVHDVIGLR